MKKKKHIDLKRIKKNNRNGLNLEWEYQKEVDGVNFTEIETRESSVVPHPDLTKVMSRCEIMLAKACNLLMTESMRKATDKVTDAQKKALKTLEKNFDNLKLTLLDKIEVTGVHFSGVEENRAVKIVGKMDTANGQAISLVTPRIVLSRDAFGFEDDLNDLLVELHDEAYAYMFENKRAQLEIEFGEKEAA